MIKNQIDVITLGCSKNLVDSEKLMKMLEVNGYTMRHNPDEVKGEVVVINTCGFIGDAKEESINMILEVCEQKSKRRVRKVFVMGCLSERYMAELGEEIPQVDGYYGKFDWNKIVSDLKADNSESSTTDCQLDRVLTTPDHYAYVKISEGCDRTCAYCAIPIITGRHVSRPMEEIVEEVRLLVSKGVSEIQLIAQDLTYYGVDIYKKQSIAELVERISDVEGVCEVVFGIMNTFKLVYIRRNTSDRRTRCILKRNTEQIVGRVLKLVFIFRQLNSHRKTLIKKFVGQVYSEMSSHLRYQRHSPQQCQQKQKCAKQSQQLSAVKQPRQECKKASFIEVQTKA